MTAAFVMTKERFNWVNLNDGNVCPDCMAISLAQPDIGRTWKTWSIMGLPGSGRTVCKNRCRCMLIPNAYAAISDTISITTGGFIVFMSTEEKKNFPTAVQSLVPLLYITLQENDVTIAENAIIGKSTRQQAEFLLETLIDAQIVVSQDLGTEIDRAGFEIPESLIAEED